MKPMITNVITFTPNYRWNSFAVSGRRSPQPPKERTS